MRQFDQCPIAFHIDLPRVVQHANDDPVHPKLLGHPNIALHGFKFRVGINEVSGSRPDQYVDRNLNMPTGRPH